MSDYTNTYTKITSDTIDTSEFSTEFTAIEASVATKADSASPTITTPTIDGVAFNTNIQRFSNGSTTAHGGGTDIDIGSIDTWATKIMIGLSGISTTGTNGITLRIGDSGGIESAAYESCCQEVDGATSSTARITSAYNIVKSTTSASTYSGFITLMLVDGAADTWVSNSAVNENDGANGIMFTQSGTKNLSTTLDRIRLSAVGGDTFDAGNIRVMWEA